MNDFVEITEEISDKVTLIQKIPRVYKIPEGTIILGERE